MTTAVTPPGQQTPAPTRDDVAARLLGLLAAVTRRPMDDIVLHDGDDFLDVLGMDSIDAVELTVQLDLAFGVGFGEDPDDLDRLATFGSLVDLVMERGQPGAGHDGVGPASRRA